MLALEMLQAAGKNRRSHRPKTLQANAVNGCVCIAPVSKSKSSIREIFHSVKCL
jgi:hypothetical protein